MADDGSQEGERDSRARYGGRARPRTGLPEPQVYSDPAVMQSEAGPRPSLKVVPEPQGIDPTACSEPELSKPVVMQPGAEPGAPLKVAPEPQGIDPTACSESELQVDRHQHHDRDRHFEEGVPPVEGYALANVKLANVKLANAKLASSHPPELLDSSSFGGKSFGLYAQAVDPRMLRVACKRYTFDSGRRARTLSLHKVSERKSVAAPAASCAVISDQDAQDIVRLLTSVKAPLVMLAASAHCEPESNILVGLEARQADPFVLDLGTASSMSDQALWRELRTKAGIGEITVPVLYCRGEKISGNSVSELLASTDSYIRSSVKQVRHIGELEVYDANVEAWVAGEVELRRPNASGVSEWLFVPSSCPSGSRFDGKTAFSDVSAVRPTGDEFTFDPQRFEVQCRSGEVISLRARTAEDASLWMEALQSASTADMSKPTAGQEVSSTSQLEWLQRWRQELGQTLATEWLQELSGLLDRSPRAAARISYSGDEFVEVLDELDEGGALFQVAGREDSSSASADTSARANFEYDV
eukprot:COSAG02_NODE_3004_length_7571_cov_65.586188_7_plen_529_part_00